MTKTKRRLIGYAIAIWFMSGIASTAPSRWAFGVFCVATVALVFTAIEHWASPNHTIF